MIWVNQSARSTIYPPPNPEPASHRTHHPEFVTLRTIDDVRIYNRALSASEVQTLYNLGR